MALKMLFVLILTGAEDWKVWACWQPEFKENSQKELHSFLLRAASLKPPDNFLTQLL